MKRKRRKKAEMTRDYVVAPEAPKYSLVIPDESIGKELTFEVTDEITKKILEKPLESMLADGFAHSGKLLSQFKASTMAPPEPVTMDSIKAMMVRVNEEREERDRLYAEALELAEKADEANVRSWYDRLGRGGWTDMTPYQRNSVYTFNSSRTDPSYTVDPLYSWDEYVYRSNTTPGPYTRRSQYTYGLPDWDAMGVDTSKFRPTEDEEAPFVPYAQIRSTGLPFGTRISEADD